MSSAPNTGDIVHLRTRHYVVERAAPGPHGTVVDLACMDDDSQGSRLSAIWELELDSEIITRQACESIGAKGFAPRETFAAFFNTLRWHCVTATDRARIESEEMSRILHEQRTRVLKTLEKTEGDPHQLDFFTIVEERRQVEDNMRYWRKWLTEVETDLETEPTRIAEFYGVKTTRIEPVGIVYLWPA